MSESATPDTGALSVDQAIEALTAPQPEVQEAPQAADAVEEQEEPQGETSSPEDAEDGAEPPAEEAEAEAEEPAVEPLDPPRYWSQDAKAKFAALPPELQAVVLQQEGPREEAAAKAKAEAAEVRKTAETEIGKVQQLAEVLADRLPQWVQSFQSRWGTQTPDWVAYAHENGIEAMTLAKTQFEQEAQQLAEASQAKTIAERQAHEAFVKAEFAKLADIAPALAHPEKGQAEREKVSHYLAKTGIPTEALTRISAVEMTLAHKAMLWDDAQAKLNAAPRTRPAAPAPRAPVRPAAAAAQSPAQRTAKEVVGRFHAKPSIDNAVALLLAKKA